MYGEFLGKLFGKRQAPRLPERVLDREFWKTHDDPSAYQYEEKYEKTFGPLFKILEKNGVKIGPIVFDIGGGSRPVSKHLIGKGKNRREVFVVDFLKPIDHRFHHVDADINTVTQPDSFAYRRKLVEITEQLSVDPRSTDKERVDAFLFSD